MSEQAVKEVTMLLRLCETVAVSTEGLELHIASYMYIKSRACCTVTTPFQAWNDVCSAVIIR